MTLGDRRGATKTTEWSDAKEKERRKEEEKGGGGEWEREGGGGDSLWADN